MNFADFVEISEVLEEFDTCVLNSSYIIESDLKDLNIANVIMTGMENIKSQDVKGVLGTLSIIERFAGAKVKDIIKLFSSEGFTKIRDFIESGIIGSEEVKHMRRMMEDPNRYKGYAGLEQYIRDMEEHNPKIFDSLSRVAERLLKH